MLDGPDHPAACPVPPGGALCTGCADLSRLARRDNGGAVSQQNVATAKRIYEARNRGDVDAVIEECDPNVEWRPHLASLSGQPIHGRDGVREYLTSLQDEFESFHHEPERFMDAGDKVVVFLQAQARGRGSGVDV